MRPTDDILRTIKKGLNVAAGADLRRRFLTDVLDAHEAFRSTRRFSVWLRVGRTTVRNHRTLATAAAVLLVALAAFCLDRGTNVAWSMDQTVAALRHLKTIHIKGTSLYQSGRTDFECWMALPVKKTDPVRMRFEEARGVIVVQGDVAYYWLRKDNEVQIKHGPQLEDLKFWYRASELSPWCTGKVLEMLKLFTDDWHQVIQTDPNTGREQVHVTCSYRPSNTSLSFMVDMETKLVQQGKMWSNLQREGDPGLDAHTFLYDENVPDKVFEFEIPAGAKVVTEGSETNVLMRQANGLWEGGSYAEAVEAFRQVHKQSPDSFEGKLALLHVGACQYRLGRFSDAITAFEDAIPQYPWRDNWLELAYFDLGRAYLNQGQKEKAFEAFEACLAANEERPSLGSGRQRKAREYIAQIKGD